jgi:DNA-binding MarR family transcriptional regulator
MSTLTPAEAAKLAFSLIQKIRQTFPDQKQLTLSSAATLMAVLANPGIKQADLEQAVGGVKTGALSKQLDLFSARHDKSTEAKKLIVKERNSENLKLNDIIVTEEGQRFAIDFAHFVNKQLDRLQR